MGISSSAPVAADVVDALVTALTTATTAMTAQTAALPLAYSRLYQLPAANGTNDTSAIAAGLSSGSKVVRGLPGESYIVTGLTVGAGVQLDMTNCTITQKASTSGDLCAVSGAKASVVGGTWDGNKANQSAGNRGIVVTGDDATVTGATVQNTKSTGIYVLGANRVRILRCSTSATDYIGIFAQTNGTTINGTAILDCLVDRSSISAGSISEGGLKVHGASSSVRADRTRVEGCTVLLPTSPTDGACVAIEVTYCRRSTVRGCITSGGAIGISLAASDYSVVDGNDVYNASGYGIENAGSDQSSVSGNVIDGNALTGIGIIMNQGGGGNAIGSMVTGNTITGCLSSIKNQTGSRAVISGNSLYQAYANYVIEVTGATDCAITGNAIEGASIATKGVMLDSCARITVSGNLFHALTQHGVLLYTASAFTITEITVTGNTFSSATVPVGTQVSGGGSVSAFCKSVGNVGSDDRLDIANDVRFVTGIGTPEGAQNGGVGSVYQRRNGGTTTSLYVKESGTGSAGWVAK